MQTPPPPSQIEEAPTPVPPSQQQAEEAQQARYAAERAILPLIVSQTSTSGEGSGDDDESSLHLIKILFILELISRSVKSSSFRNDHQLEAAVSDTAVANRVLPDAQSAFKRLAASELPDDQAAVLWATWAYSRTADEIVRIINGGQVDHEFSGTRRKLRKVWISRSDRKVRPLHAKLHGKTISASEDFWRWPDTGKRLRWPGDIEAPLEATAGCRCVCLLTWADQDGVSSTIRKIVEVTE